MLVILASIVFVCKQRPFITSLFAVFMINFFISKMLDADKSSKAQCIHMTKILSLGFFKTILILIYKREWRNW